MTNRIRAKISDRLRESIDVSQVSLDQKNAARHVLSGAGRQIVVDHDFVAPRQKRINGVAADKARAAGHEHFHISLRSWARLRCARICPSRPDRRAPKYADWASFDNGRRSQA